MPPSRGIRQWAGDNMNFIKLRRTIFVTICFHATTETRNDDDSTELYRGLEGLRAMTIMMMIVTIFVFIIIFSATQRCSRLKLFINYILLLPIIGIVVSHFRTSVAIAGGARCRILMNDVDSDCKWRSLQATDLNFRARMIAFRTDYTY